ncbi:MAG TPA: tripartite tricarboxylate transporter substrate binding protein [bacterium]|nr:tripartite tricarboxylate transporter substrate binding protein [bacterium]HQO33364.1 tripartite tricarboxylate transporter substrate binding protein [bacterium]HQP98604.1 tripartite tricarboxylate transporter substrate binding protein [bacterium]
MSSVRKAKQKFSIGVVSVCLGMILIGCGQGREESPDEFPSRAIQIICPWGAGGGTDTVSRICAKGLQEVLGARVNVINEAGGAGVSGHAAGAKAKPDGYTLTMLTAEIDMMHWRGLTDVGPTNFEPIMIMNKVCGSIFVRENSPWQTMQDLRNAVQENPGKFTASGTAKGGIWHLACAAWLSACGLSPDALTWVPSTGAAAGLQQLISEGIDVVFCSPAEGKPLLDAGKVRLIAILSSERNPMFPDVPTCVEQGVNAEIYGWAGLAAPIGTPQPILNRLEDALQEVAATKDFETSMHNVGFLVDTENAQRFREILQADDIQFGQLLKDAGIVE